MYIQLKDIVKKQIAEGVFKPDMPLPSERELCTIYKISHITVRQALVELTKEGILFRVPGRGTYIKDGNHMPGNTMSILPLGIVIPDIGGSQTSPFVSDLLLGIKSISTKYNYPIMLYTENESNYLVDMEAGRLQGLILTDPMSKDTRIAMIQNKNIPLVVIGKTNIPGIKSVDSNNVWIGYTLTSHIIDSGYGKIGFINGPLHFTVSDDRLEGYIKALDENKIPFDESIVRYGPFSEEDGYKNARLLLEKNVNAILCADDFIALGALRATKESGLKIPEEIGLAGCNNSPFTCHIHPALSTIDIFPHLIGQAAAEKLIKVIEGKKTEERTTIKGKFIKRESTDKNAGGDKKQNKDKEKELVA